MQSNKIQHSSVTLDNIINDTFLDYENNMSDDKDYSRSFINVLKKYNFWPALQVKKFKGMKNMLLLHNTYLRDDINEFKELYEQCRSVVLDFEAPSNNKNIVISYSNSIPVRISTEEYNNMIDINDCYTEALDGTTVTCYYYNNMWHFGTTSCPNINSSRFSHPTKTHGIMLDDVLKKLLNNYNDDVRNIFVDKLDKNISYVFVLLHHENKHIVDYKNIFGENYMELYHIDSKYITNMQNIDISNKPFSNLGIKYPIKFSNVNEANNYIHDINNNTYGYIIKRITNNGYSLAKISPDNINYRENTDPCNPNPWYNLLTTYMKNKIDYHINDYIRDYNPNIEPNYDNNGKSIDPTYLIHTSICTIKDILYQLYSATTTYNQKKNLFKMNKEIDKRLAPILRYHLAKLRKRQVTVYNYTLNQRDIYYYLCHCIRPKDIKQIINLLTTTSGYDISDRSMMCLVILNKLLD